MTENTMICLKCKKPMTNWEWVRYTGKGPWATHPWSCKHCHYYKDGTKEKPIKEVHLGFIKINEHRGARITSSQARWDEDIRSRRVLPNGDIAIVNHKGEIKEVRPKGVSLRNLK